MTKLEIQAAGGDTATPLNLQKRLDWICAVAGPVRGKSVIDCGCGAGEYVRALTALGADAWGIEYSAEKIGDAKRRGALPEGRLAVGDIEAVEFADDRFDVALLNEVLEHVPRDDQGIREVHRILKPGGVAVIFSPNRLYPFETHGVSLRSGRRSPTTHLSFRTSPCAWAYSNIGRETTGPGNCAHWSAQAGFRSSVSATSGRPSKTFPVISRA